MLMNCLYFLSFKKCVTSMMVLWIAIVIGLTSLCCTSCRSDDEEDSNNENVEKPNNDDDVPNGTYIAGKGYAFDGFFYEIDINNGTAMLLRIDDETIEDVTIPQHIELAGKTYPVTNINGDVCSGLKQLTNVNLPSTITDIGTSAFNGCEKLASINLPDGLTTIRLYTFQNCKSLQSISLPQNLTTISNYAFKGCENLTSILFPTTLKTIGEEAFRSCNGLKEVIIPEGVTTLGLNAFKDCRNLKSITIPASVNCYMSPFEGCNAITYVNISCRTVIGEFGYNVEQLILGEGAQCISENAFEDCRKLSTVEFSKTINVIGPSSFSGCSSLTSIVLPENLLVIQDRAFYNCQNLKSITCLAPTPPNFSDISGYPVFDPETQENGTLYVPSASVEIYKSTTGWSDFKNIVGI